MVNNVSLLVTERETPLWIHGAKIVYGRLQSQSASVYTHNALHNIQDGDIFEMGYGASFHLPCLFCDTCLILQESWRTILTR